MKGSDILVRCLDEQGIETVFGYPGGTVLSLYDSLSRYGKIRLITPCHEQFACHAADGYARATGKTGVVIATSGPGATNLVTGIANAYMDSVPLVAITGNVALEQLGRDYFQEIDIAGVTMPITKHNYIVKSIEELAPVIREAFYYAQAGRKGPILVDIPKNIFEEDTAYIRREKRPLPKKQPNNDEIIEAAALIRSSSRPFVCAGGGVIRAGAAAALKTFAETLKAPVAMTAMGIGSFPRDHAQCTGLVGMRASAFTRGAMSECDLFIGVGTRFSDRLVANVNKYSPGVRVLHMDIDEAEIDKNIHAFSSVCGDLGTALRSLSKLVNPRPAPWITAERFPAEHPSPYIYRVLSELCRDAVFTTEVGLHQLGACENMRINKPRRFITSGGLGTMGFGLPAAIGASLGTGLTAVNIAGDGSFNMNLAEITTAVKYSLPLIQVVCNNRQLGMITGWQDGKYGGRHVENITPPLDYAAAARAMGADGFTVSTERELADAVTAALSSGRVTVIDVRLAGLEE